MGDSSGRSYVTEQWHNVPLLRTRALDYVRYDSESNGGAYSASPSSPPLPTSMISWLYTGGAPNQLLY